MGRRHSVASRSRVATVSAESQILAGLVFLAGLVCDHRSKNSGCMPAVVVQGVDGSHGLVGKLYRQWESCLRVRLVEWCSRAGDGDTDAMAAVKDLTQPAHAKPNFDDFAWREQHFLPESFAIT